MSSRNPAIARLASGVAALDYRGLLDRPAIDRIVKAALDAFGREVDAAQERRFRRALSGDRRLVVLERSPQEQAASEREGGHRMTWAVIDAGPAGEQVRRGCVECGQRERHSHPHHEHPDRATYPLIERMPAHRSTPAPLFPIGSAVST